MKGGLILIILLISYTNSELTSMDKKELADLLISKVKKESRVSTFLQDNMHDFRSNATIEITGDYRITKNRMTSLGFNFNAFREVEKIYNRKAGSCEIDLYKDNINELNSQRVKENKTMFEIRDTCYKNYRKAESGVELDPGFYRCLTNGAYKYKFVPQDLKVEYSLVIARMKNGAFQSIIVNGYTKATPNKVYAIEVLEGCKFQYQGINSPKDFENMKKILSSRTLTKITSKYFDEIDKINKEIYQENDSSEGIPDQKKLNFINILREKITTSKTMYNFESLIINIKSEPEEVHMSTFKVDEIPIIAEKYGFPQELLDKLEAFIFQKEGNSFEYELFDIPEGYKPTYFSATKYLGSVKTDKKTVFLAFIKTKVKGEPPYRANSHASLECRNYNCVFKCKETLLGYSDAEKIIIQKILSTFASDSFYQRIDSMMKAQTLLYQSVPMRVGNFRAKIETDGTIKIYNIKTGQQIQCLGNKGDSSYAPYTLQLDDNGKLSIVNKFYEKSSLLFSGGKGTGPYTLSISDDGKLVLFDINKVQVYKS